MKSNRSGVISAAVLAAATFLVLAGNGPAFSQGLDPSLPGSPGCSPSTLPQTSGPPRSTDLDGSANVPEDLSDRLARSDGVICPPPHGDQDIKLPTPDAGRTPVIPPPSSEDPTLRPK